MSRQIICKTCKSPAIQDGDKITCTGCGLETEGLSFAWIIKEVEEQKIQEGPKMEEKKTEQETNTTPKKKTKLCEVEGCTRQQWKGRMCYKIERHPGLHRRKEVYCPEASAETTGTIKERKKWTTKNTR